MTNAEPDFGYAEVFIPWADFDATNPDAGEFTDTGLYHPDCAAGRGVVVL